VSSSSKLRPRAADTLGSTSSSHHCKIVASRKWLLSIPKVTAHMRAFLFCVPDRLDHIKGQQRKAVSPDFLEFEGEIKMEPSF
jgi:hypothetical protein